MAKPRPWRKTSWRANKLVLRNWFIWLGARAIDRGGAGLYCPRQQVTQVGNTAYAQRPFPARRCRSQVSPCVVAIRVYP